MSQRTWNSDYGPIRGLYRDTDNAWVFGVCSGIADRFNLRPGAVRLVTIIAFLLFSWATALFYLCAWLLVREKPLVYRGRHSEDEFWRRT